MLRHGLAAVLGLLLWAAPAGAQMVMPASDAHEPQGRLALGGELAATIGPEDHSAYFNYTDYQHNALRIARIRLFGEWHLVHNLSVVGELRIENATDLTAPGLYVRWQPRAWPGLTFQVGRLPPVIGAYPRRAYGTDEAVIGQPLAYQYLTSLRTDALPNTMDDVLRMRAQGWSSGFPVGAGGRAPGVPLVSVSGWDTGGEVLWQRGWLDLAGALSRGSPADPVIRDANQGLMWSGRAAAHFPAGLTLGISGARGQWLSDSVLALTAAGSRTPASQAIIGADAEFGWGHWLVRGEWLRTAFDVPLVQLGNTQANLKAWSTFAETRYRVRPRWDLGFRAERLEFGNVHGTADGSGTLPWDAPVTRLEGTIGFRVTHQFELRTGWQENWRAGGHVRERGFPAFSALYWF